MEKTNEQLHQEFQDALKTLCEKLYNLLHYGSYSLEYVNRDFKTNVVTSAHLRMDDALFVLKLGDKLKFLQKEGSEVTLLLPDNPVDQKLLDAWDIQSIDNDIAYHIKTLEALQKQKSNLQEKYGKDEGSE